MTDRAAALSRRGLLQACLVLAATLPLGALGLRLAGTLGAPLGQVLLVVLPASLSVGLVGRGWEELCGSHGRSLRYGVGLVVLSLVVGLGLGAAVGLLGAAARRKPDRSLQDLRLFHSSRRLCSQRNPSELRAR